MKGERFLKSKWVAKAEKPNAELQVRSKYERWLSRVGNWGLVSRAGDLWRLLTSGEVSGQDKVIVIAGLLYLISPIDVIPDFIPFIGWLDDLGVAAFVVAYVTRKADEFTSQEGKT